MTLLSSAPRGLAAAILLSLPLAALSQAGHAQGNDSRAATVSAPVPDLSSNRTVFHLLGPGLPGGEARQSVAVGSRTPVFTVLGFNGEVSAPVDSPYDARNTYATFAGQPGRGSTAILASSIVGAP